MKLLLRLLLILVASHAVADSTNGWTPPVGCPMPLFGVTNTHWMYCDPAYTWDYGAGPVPYRSNSFGPYTHYVDADAAGATDSGNTWGTPVLPRVTWPANVAAGSVVQIADRGTPYVFGNLAGRLWCSGRGTDALPVFFVGVGTPWPTINQQFVIGGTNVIVENIRLAVTNGSTRQLRFRQDLYGAPMSKLVLRDAEIFGDGTFRGTPSIAAGNGNFSITDILLMRLNIHDAGDWQSPVEDESHAILFGPHWVGYAQIYNSTCARVGGDFVQYGDPSGSITATNFGCFIGYNEVHHPGENAVDIKVANGVVVSQNYFHDIRPAVHTLALGEGIAGHYYPSNLWFLNNLFVDVEEPIRCTNLRMNGRAIGNVIVRSVDAAFTLYGGGNWLTAHNTIVSPLDAFFLFNSGPSSFISLNDLVVDATNRIFQVDQTGVLANTTVSNLCVYSATDLEWYWGSAGAVYSSLASWQAASGDGQNSLNADPILTGSYTLTAGSPCIGAAMDASGITAEFQTTFGFPLLWNDRDGNPRDGEIGAYGFVSGTNAPVWFRRVRLPIGSGLGGGL